MSKRNLENEISVERKGWLITLATDCPQVLKAFVLTGVFDAGWPQPVRDLLANDQRRKEALRMLKYLEPREIDFFNNVMKVNGKKIKVEFIEEEPVEAILLPTEETRPLIKSDPLMELAIASTNQLNARAVVDLDSEPVVVATYDPKVVTFEDVENAKTQLLIALAPRSAGSPVSLLHEIEKTVALMKAESKTRDEFGARLAMKMEMIYTGTSEFRVSDTFVSQGATIAEGIEWENKLIAAFIKIGAPETPDVIRFNVQNYVSLRRNTLLREAFITAMRLKLGEILTSSISSYQWSRLSSLSVVPLLEQPVVDWTTPAGCSEFINRLFTTQKKGICINEASEWHADVIKSLGTSRASEYIGSIASMFGDYTMGDKTRKFLTFLEERKKRSGEVAYYAPKLFGEEDLTLEKVASIVGSKVCCPMFIDYCATPVIIKGVDGGSAYLQVLNRVYPVNLCATVRQRVIQHRVESDLDVEAFLITVNDHYVSAACTQQSLVEAALSLQYHVDRHCFVLDVVNTIVDVVRCIVDSSNYYVFDARVPGVQAKEGGVPKGQSPVPDGQITGFVMGLQGGNSITYQFPKKSCYYYVAVPLKDDGSMKLRLTYDLPSARWDCNDAGYSVYKIVGQKPYKVRAVHSPPHSAELWTVFRFMMPTREASSPLFAVAFDDEGVIGWMQLNDRAISSEGSTDCVISRRAIGWNPLLRNNRDSRCVWHLSGLCNPRLSVLSGRTYECLLMS